MFKKITIIAIMIWMPIAIFSGSKIEIKKLTENIYLLECISIGRANVLVFVGDDGVLMVDSAHKIIGEKLRKEVEELGKSRVKYLINSHCHHDHTGGNEAFCETTKVITHKNGLKPQHHTYYNLPHSIINAKPDIVFEKEFKLEFNNETILLRPLPNSHSDTDILVYFKKAKVLHIGDLVFKDRLPYIDNDQNGNLDNLISSIQILINDYPSDTRYICGHRDEVSKADLKAYLKMIKGTAKVIKDAVKKGYSVDDIISKNLLHKWQRFLGYKGWLQYDWVRAVYRHYSPDNVHELEPVSAPLTAMILDKGVKYAVDQYHKIKKHSPDKYNYEPLHLFRLGYELNVRGYMDEGTVIYKLAQSLLKE